LTNYFFYWKGISSEGMRCSGKCKGPHKKAVEKNLLEQQITPLSIKINNHFQLGLIKRKISTRQIHEFTQQLGLLLQTGFSLEKSLTIILKGQNCTKFQKFICSIKSSLESGKSFATTLQQFPKLFDPVYCNLINAGENAGTLTKTLIDLSNYFKRSTKLKTKIHKAMIYPLTVFCTAILITIGLLLYVVPEFKSIFDGFGAKLPWLTRIVITLSSFLQRSFLLVGTTITFIAVIAHFTLRHAKFRHLFHQILLKLPIIKKIIITTTIARWTRVLATTSRAGIPLLNSLKYAEDSISNLAIKETVKKLRYEVKQGQSLTHALQHRPYFPQQAWTMVAIGEDSGTLDTALLQVAAIYTTHADNLLDNLSKLLEPVIMLILAILMGGLIIAMYLPIFKLGSVI